MSRKNRLLILTLSKVRVISVWMNDVEATVGVGAMDFDENATTLSQQIIREIG